MIDALSQQIWFYPALAFIACAVLMRPGRAIARAIGLTDKPGGRKRHEGDIPLFGGLVLVPVFIVFLMLLDFSQQHLALCAGLLILLAVGAIDDLRGLSPNIKFLAQFAAAFLIVLPGEAQLYQLGNLFNLGDVGLDFMSIPFSVIAVVLLINAVNLMDGLDGLASGSVFVMLLWLVIVYVLAGQVGMSGPLLIMLGSLGAFLFYNLRTPMHPKASVFLGDAGSLCLGLILAYFAIHAAKVPALELQPISVAWVLALPIMDTCAQFNRRLREGRHPFDPDRGHFHHHFVDAGFGGGQATALICLIVFLLGAFGVLSEKFGFPTLLLTLLWVAAILSHMAMSVNPERYTALIAKIKI